MDYPVWFGVLKRWMWVLSVRSIQFTHRAEPTSKIFLVSKTFRTTSKTWWERLRCTFINMQKINYRLLKLMQPRNHLCISSDTQSTFSLCGISLLYKGNAEGLQGPCWFTKGQTESIILSITEISLLLLSLDICKSWVPGWSITVTYRLQLENY